MLLMRYGLGILTSLLTKKFLMICLTQKHYFKTEYRSLLNKKTYPRKFSRDDD